MRTPSAMAKTAAKAPVPSASVKMATALAPRAASRDFSAERTSAARCMRHWTPNRVEWSRFRVLVQRLQRSGFTRFRVRVLNDSAEPWRAEAPWREGGYGTSSKPSLDAAARSLASSDTNFSPCGCSSHQISAAASCSASAARNGWTATRRAARRRTSSVGRYGVDELHQGTQTIRGLRQRGGRQRRLSMPALNRGLAFERRRPPDRRLFVRNELGRQRRRSVFRQQQRHEC